MCQMMNTPTRVLGCLREIRAAGLLVLPEDYLDGDESPEEIAQREDCCLCGVDTRAIANRSGLPYDWDDLWSEVTFRVELRANQQETP